MQDNIRVEKERKYWDKYAPRYDRGIEKYWGFYSALVDKISQDVEVGNTVLEVAAGTGAISLKVAERAARVYAVDISPLMVDEAKKKKEEKGIGNVEFSVHDAYSLPFDKSMFDTVICCSALHNMVNPEKALSEMNRVLKPEGRLIAPTICQGEYFKHKLMMTIFKLVVVGFPAFHKFSFEELSNLVTESGFIIRNKEIIREMVFPIAYIVAELNYDSELKNISYKRNEKRKNCLQILIKAKKAE